MNQNDPRQALKQDSESARAARPHIRRARPRRTGPWFPHVPLALAVGLAGLAQFLLSLSSVRDLLDSASVPAGDIGDLSGGFYTLAIHGVSQEIIGGFLILLSIGLLLRSRLAWVVTLLMTAATVGLEFVGGSLSVPVVIYGVVLIVLLVAAHDSFHRASLATNTSVAIVGVVAALGYGVLGSYALGKDFSPAISSFNSALYFAVVTLSTVGYGDITPHTPEARLFTISLIVLGLVVFATSLTAVAAVVMNKRMLALLHPRKERMKRKDHIIVVGDTPLTRSVITALQKRGIQVTAIWYTRPADGADAPDDLVIGDGGDSSVLESAGIAHARACLALGESDSDNAFVALAAKDASKDVRTVVAVNDARNMGRVRHARPDVVIALPVIGGELLAMALSGEEVNADELFEGLADLS